MPYIECISLLKINFHPLIIVSHESNLALWPMLVILAGVSRKEEEGVQIKQMTLLTGLVDLVPMSSITLYRTSRTTDSSSYAVAPFQNRHFDTLLRQHFRTP